MQAVRILIAFALLMSLHDDGLGNEVNMPPRSTIPAGADPDVKRLIEELYAEKATERGKAAALLGFGGPRAAGAVPFLIEMLEDDTALKWVGSSLYEKRMPYPGIITSPGEEAKKALERIGHPSVEPLIKALSDSNSGVRSRAAAALKTISGKNLGTDPEAWKNWWKEDREERERKNIRIYY